MKRLTEEKIANVCTYAKRNGARDVETLEIMGKSQEMQQIDTHVKEKNQEVVTKYISFRIWYEMYVREFEHEKVHEVFLQMESQVLEKQASFPAPSHRAINRLIERTLKGKMRAR